jgi:peptidoglycan-N-acetylglucosamine deacetylase
MYVTKIPRIVSIIYNKYIWRIPNDANVIYLTFDDGPHPVITPWVLDVLKQYNVIASFFCIGNHAQQYADIIKRIKNEGHAIGNHTHNHEKGWVTDNYKYVQSVERAAQCMPQTKLFRPPYGKIKRAQANALRNLGYQIIMWDIISADFDNNISTEQCYLNAIKGLDAGSIIVFHDSEKAKLNMQYALPKFLDYALKSGFLFKALV